MHVKKCMSDFTGTVRRHTNRWPKNCFYYMIDATAINSTICYQIRNPEGHDKNLNRARRKTLENHALALIKAGINRRVEIHSLNNFARIQLNDLKSFY